MSKVTIKKRPIPNNRGNDPMAALGGSNQGEIRVQLSQMHAIEHIYTTNSSLRAARVLLMGQLLSSGLVLRRNGEPITLKQTFEDHLRSYWLPFARSVIDSFLKFGFCVVSIEEEPRKPFSDRGEGSSSGSSGSSGSPGSSGSSSASIGPDRVVKADPADVSAAATPAAKGANLIPIVPILGTYELVLVPTGRGGYMRETQIFTTASTHAYQRDDFMECFYRDQPDSNGNVNSPIASCFNLLSYVEQLKELAMTAEITRAQPTLVTQSVGVKNQNATAGMDQANLFFDAESRDLQQQSTDEQSADRQKQLQMVVALAGEVNRLRTHNRDGNPSAPSAPVSAAPEVPPRLFALPEKQSLVPNALQPQARSDLEQLMRFANEAICSSLGVPASVIFEGKFSSNSMSQLQLLNTTVASLAVSVNSVLSQTYNALYGGSRDAGELVLSTAPLCATTEVQALYASQIIDFETALPAAMHSLGCSSASISAALERRRKEEEKKRKREELAEKVEAAEGKARIRTANNPSLDGGGAKSTASEKATTATTATTAKAAKAPPSEAGSAPEEE